jgi:hypothetical protein
MTPLEKKGFLGSSIDGWIQKIRAKHQHFFTLADEVNEQAQKLMFELTPHTKHVQELLVASFYMRSLSNYQATLLLVERGMMPEARLMLRAQLDVLFFLCAIGKKSELAKDYIEEDQQFRVKILRKLKDLYGDNLPMGIRSDDLKLIEQELKNDIDASKIVVRSTEQWAQEAGLHGWYLSAYAILSMTVHAKVRDLERYLVVDNKGEIRGLKWGPDDSGVKEVFTTAIESMLLAMNGAAEVYQKDIGDIINNLHAKLNEIVGAVPDHT